MTILRSSPHFTTRISQHPRYPLVRPIRRIGSGWSEPVRRLYLVDVFVYRIGTMGFCIVQASEIQLRVWIFYHENAIRPATQPGRASFLSSLHIFHGKNTHLKMSDPAGNCNCQKVAENPHVSSSRHYTHSDFPYMNCIRLVIDAQNSKEYISILYGQTPTQ